MPNHPLTAHVAAASLNQTVGDWAGNLNRIRDAIAVARARGARLLVLPEMCIPGYSLGDRLAMRGTLERSWQSLDALRADTDGIVVLVGLPVRHRDVLYNAVAIVADGRIWGIVPKENLATGDVQYENRWFSGWQRGRVETFRTPDGDDLPFGSLLFAADGVGTFGVEVCEDGWKGTRPGSLLALAGAHVICNPSASWFTLGKHRIRRSMVEQISREDHTAYLYTSLLGCDATRLVFDGTVLIAQDGQVLEEGRRFLFTESMEVVDRVLDLAALQRARTEEGSWRQQVDAMQRGDYGPIPPVVAIAGDYRTDRPAPAPSPYWLDGTQARSVDPSLRWLTEARLIPAPAEADLPHLELELALCMALREYQRKCGIPGFALALSGGRDSAMCALLIGRMYRYDQPQLDPAALRAHVHSRFECAYLATENSGQQTRDAARRVAEEVGATYYDGNIQQALDTHLRIIGQMTGDTPSWTNPRHDIPLQNVQARLRGSLIWMLANLKGYLLIATSNKSEAAVGYATMDGDTSGGIAPLADVPKSLIIVWLDWAARFHGLSSIADVCAMPASAELRPPDRKQTDEDDLMPFPVLDQLMFAFVQRGQDPVEMFRTLWPVVDAPWYRGDAAAFAAHIRKFVRLFCQAQWKRERFAISFRVTAFDLDPKTGFRFPPVQAPFTAELAELDALIAAR
jgi:NAD+ synthase (glutamine-hydrolysing)